MHGSDWREKEAWEGSGFEEGKLTEGRKGYTRAAAKKRGRKAARKRAETKKEQHPPCTSLSRSGTSGPAWPPGTCVLVKPGTFWKQALGTDTEPDTSQERL